MARHLSKLFWVLLALFSEWTFSGCKPPLKPDYYTQLMQNGCHPNEIVLTPECKNAILDQGIIHVASFGDHPEILDSVVQSIHVLMNIPLAFPENRKMFGLAPLEEAKMPDFIATFLKDKNANLNQQMVNYVLNAAPQIMLIDKDTKSCEGAVAFYDKTAIHICADSFWSEPDQSDGVIGALTLFHEARHQSVSHTIHCPSDPLQTGLPKCDNLMDGAHGWEVALGWGMMQGGGQSPFPSNLSLEKKITGNVPAALYDTASLPRYIIGKLNYRIFFDSPNPLQGAKENGFTNQYIQSLPEIEGLEFPMPLHSRLGFKQTQSLPSSYIPTDKRPSVMTSGDFDGDGRVDLALVSKQQVFILFNQGQAQFNWVRASTIAFPSNDYNDGNYDLLAGDFDGDHHLDLLVTGRFFSNSSYKSSYIFWGDGTGNFSGPSKPLGGETLHSPILADLNQDGLPDVVAFWQKGTLSALSTTSRSFKMVNFLPKESINLENILLVDTNQDTTPDLIAITAGTINVYLGKRDGTFRDSAWTQNVFIQPEQIVLAGDFNQDHQLDLWLPLDSPHLLFGKGDGTFGSPFSVSFVERYDFKMPELHVAVLDVNHDGYVDFIDLDRGTISYGTMIPDVRRTIDISVQMDYKLPSSTFVLADVDQDGWVDLALLKQGGGVELLLGQPVSP